ncbi:MAG: site-specific integrase, partial [Planctomycetes bacterium]|nr:site-specific integrase [Planctomycetota bacterium]
AGRKRQIAVFLLNTSVRNGELCALDIDDLRIDEEAQLVHVFGKGLKYRWVPLNRAALAGELRKSANACDEDLQVNAHNLRHTFATWLVRTVADVSLAQKILGHEDVNTTLRYYVHTSNWELAGATDNLRPKRRVQRSVPPESPAAPKIIKFPRKYVG